MDLSYNYRALRDFMLDNHLAKKDLLEAIGCQDYVSLNKWLSGQVPLHITAMLRFCNYYQVPLSMFFIDHPAMDPDTPRPAEVIPATFQEGDQTLPTGYTPTAGKGRGIVETRITNRIATSIQQQRVVARNLAQAIESECATVPESPSPSSALLESPSPAPTLADILALEVSHLHERQHLLDIIDRLTRALTTDEQPDI